MTSIHKFVTITKEVAVYINNLLDVAEWAEMKKVREETEAIEHGEMQAPISQLRVIISLIKMIDAKRVLEVGTFRGTTAARLAEAMPNGEVLTIERDLRYVDELKKRWERLGVEKRIHLLSGQATEVLDSLVTEKPFDLAFIDADKEKYKEYVEKTLILLRPKGVLLVDNTLWRGEVTEANTDSNLTRYVKDFNTWVFEKFGASASIVPAWDGMTIIVKE